MTDDRSERLRKRRKRSNRQSPREESRTNGSPDTSQSAADTQDESENGDSDQTAGAQTGSVKEERVGTYMYLPESQLKDLKRRYNVLKAEYEFEYDEEFEKNRHFYPLVIKHGLDSLDRMDVSEIRESLEGI